VFYFSSASTIRQLLEALLKKINARNEKVKEVKV
jgi:hypothetical protein